MKKTRYQINIGKLLFLIVGILIGAFGPLLIPKTAVNNNKIKLASAENGTVTINTPVFADYTLVSTTVEINTKANSDFVLLSRGNREPTLLLCEPQYGENEEAQNYDCTDETKNYNGNEVTVIYKKIKSDDRPVTIVVGLKNMLAYQIQIDKRSSLTRQPDYFTDDEVKMWIEEIKKW